MGFVPGSDEGEITNAQALLLMSFTDYLLIVSHILHFFTIRWRSDGQRIPF